MTYDERVMQYHQPSINAVIKGVSLPRLVWALLARFETFLWGGVTCIIVGLAILSSI